MNFQWDEEADRLFALRRELGLKTRLLDRIEDNFLREPKVLAIEVPALRAELVDFRHARIESLLREKLVRAKDPQVRSDIAARLGEKDRLIVRLDQLLRMCDDAIAGQGAIVGFSD